MSHRFSLKGVAATLLASCIATTFTAPASATSPAESYVPILPPLIFPLPLFERPLQASCAIDATTSSFWFATRDVHVKGYDGWSVESAKFRYRASASGTYTFKLTLRDLNRSGHMIAQTTERTLELTAGTSVDAKTFFGNAYVGRTTDLSISHSDISGPGILYFGRSAGSCANAKLSETDGTIDPTETTDIGFELRGDETHYTNNVVEYYVPALNKYFITAHTNDQAALDALPDFQRTGRSFLVPKKSVYTNVINVYRFFSPEAVSHFYVDKTGHDIIIANPAFGLNDEGIDFGSVKPDYSGGGAGICPSWAPVKVNRSYHNAPVVNQRNHRYTNNTNDYNAMTGLGWAPEGTAFCAYSATNPFAM
jgi:Repeat of unknown function (DUF5648)